MNGTQCRIKVVNPFTPRESPFDELNRLELDSKIYQVALGLGRVINAKLNAQGRKSKGRQKKGKKHTQAH